MSKNGFSRNMPIGLNILTQISCHSFNDGRINVSVRVVGGEERMKEEIPASGKAMILAPPRAASSHNSVNLFMFPSRSPLGMSVFPIQIFTDFNIYPKQQNIESLPPSLFLLLHPLILHRLFFPFLSCRHLSVC